MTSLATIARWARRAPKERNALLLAVLGLFVSSYLIGWLIGRADSPDYDSEVAALTYIAANLRVVERNEQDVVLQARGGLATYRYRLTTNAVEVLLPPPSVVAKTRPQPRNVLAEQERLIALIGLSATAPLTTAGALRQATSSTKATPRSVRTAAAVALTTALVGGGWLGYRVGYEDRLDYDAPTFVKGLRNPLNWRPFAEPIARCSVLLKGMHVLGNQDSPEAQRLSTFCAAYSRWAQQP